MYNIKFFFVLAMLLSLCFVIEAADPEVFVIKGDKREAIVIAPSTKTDHPPIVFCWHGGGGTMQASVNLFKIETLWPEAVVVYPQGLPGPSKKDPAVMKNRWQDEPGQSGDRDLEFFDHMLTKLSGQYHVDSNRVYSVGFSAGSGFTYVLWSQRQAKIAAAGIIAGAISDADKPLNPMPAFIVAGKQDTTCPFQEQVNSIKYDRTVNGIGPNVQVPPQNGVRYFHGSKADLAVMIHDGGHVYPQGASQKVVAFFQNHNKEAAKVGSKLTLVGTPSVPGQYKQSIDRPEGPRSYLLYVPTSYKPKPQTLTTDLQSSSLVIILHGGGGTGSAMIGSTKFNDKADAERIVVAYPDATPDVDGKQMWNGGISPSPTPTTVNDVGFLSALIDKLSKDLNIDEKRVYVAGFSNGSMMAQRVGLLLPGKVAAMAVIESSIGIAPIPAPGEQPQYERLTPADAKGKLSVLMIHCKGDKSVPYLGGIGGINFPSYWLPLSDAVDMWTDVDNCNPANKVVSMEGTTEVVEFPNCDSSTAVKVYLVAGGTHFWPMPGSSKVPPTFTFNSTDVVWDFFKNHGKP